MDRSVHEKPREAPILWDSPELGCQAQVWVFQHRIEQRASISDYKWVRQRASISDHKWVRQRANISDDSACTLIHGTKHGTLKGLMRKEKKIIYLDLWQHVC